MGFQTPKYRLAKLLEQVGDGTIQLPDFQRGYKWDDERVRSLLVTITQGYPLGVIMLLDSGSDHVRFKPRLWKRPRSSRTCCCSTASSD
jgi:uncharacterized protein with ParB-like and HNH nuclease domain